jgi:hypothetical protein
MVIVNFIRDKEVGIFARAKRLSKRVSPKLTGQQCNGPTDPGVATEEEKHSSDESDGESSDKSQ